MKFSFYSVALLSLIWACAACGPTPPSENASTDRLFRVSTPSHLFFKNLRVTDYLQRNRAGSKADLYYPQEMMEQPDQPGLVPYIVDDWMNDQAFVFFELLPADTSYASPVQLVWEGTEGVDSFTVRSPTPQQYYELSQILYRELPGSTRFFLVDKAQVRVPIWGDDLSRKKVLMTLRDYYKLIDEM